MEIISGVILVILTIITYLVYTISGGEWFADNSKTQEVGKRCVEREYDYDVFDNQTIEKNTGFRDKILCEIFSLSESDHTSENFDYKPIFDIFTGLGLDSFISPDFIEDREDFDAFVKDKTYVHIANILSYNKNVVAMLDYFEVKYFTWFVWHKDDEPVEGDMLTNYKNYNKKNKRFNYKPSEFLDVYYLLIKNPGVLYAVTVYFMDRETKKVLLEGHVLTIMYINGEIHVMDSNVYPNWNYFSVLSRFGVPVKGNYDNIIYKLLYKNKGEKRALQTSESSKHFETFGNCQTWQFLIMIIYCMNPNKKPTEIVSLLLALGDSAKILMMNYWYYVYIESLSMLNIKPVGLESIYKLRDLIKEIVNDDNVSSYYKLILYDNLKDIRNINIKFVFKLLSSQDVTTKQQFIKFCSTKLPIIFKQISDDLRAFKNVDVLIEDGTTTTVKIPTALIHEKYLQGLFIKNDAPSFVLRIMFKQDDDVCTIL